MSLVSQVYEKMRKFSLGSGDIANFYAIHEIANGNVLGIDSFFPDIAETPVFCLSGARGWYSRFNNKRIELRKKYPNAFYLEDEWGIFYLFTREEVDACKELTELCAEIKKNKWCDIHSFLEQEHQTHDVFIAYYKAKQANKLTTF